MATDNKLLQIETKQVLLKYDAETKAEVMYKDIMDTSRRFRVDFYCPRFKLIIEIQGGIHKNGRHTKAAGYMNDCYKCRLAQLNGFKWFPYTYEQLQDGDLIKDLEMLKEVKDT